MAKTKTTPKKNTKKYQLTRSQLVERLTELQDRVDNVSTFDMSPADVADELSSFSAALADLQYEVDLVVV